MDFDKMNLEGMTLEQRRITIFRSFLEELKGKRVKKVEDILTEDIFNQIKNV